MTDVQRTITDEQSPSPGYAPGPGIRHLVSAKAIALFLITFAGPKPLAR